MIKHKMTLHIAQRQINDFMQAADLRPEFKWYCESVEVSFAPPKKVDEKFFQTLMLKSKTNEKFWIPAISYFDNLFVAPGVKILSDGEKEYFVAN